MSTNNKEILRIYEDLKKDFPFKGYIETASQVGLHVAHALLPRLPQKAKILDFGAGACDKTALLARLGFTCRACDDLGDEWCLENNHRDIILAFAQKEGIPYDVLDGGSLPSYQEKSFDAVLILDVIEHLHNSPREILNRLVTCLKPGGLLVVAMPNSVNLRKRLSVLLGKTNYTSLESFYFSGKTFRGHVREYTQRETEKLLTYQGLEVVFSRCLHTVLHKHKKMKYPLFRFIYQALTGPFPRLRDSFIVMGRKPDSWQPVVFSPELLAKHTRRPVIRPKQETSLPNK